MTRRALALALSVLSWALPAHAVQRILLNPSFETPAITGGACVTYVNQSLAGGWATTETVTSNAGGCSVPTGTGGILEYWSNGFNGVAADNGANHIELNAYNPARVSQSLCLVAGDQVNWQFSHRARDIGLGAASRDVALFSVDSSANSVRTASTSAVGGTGGSYSSSSGGVSNNSSTATTVGNWGRYSGSFTWTGSSGAHSIGFEAISNSTNNPGIGNFLDNVQLTLKPVVEFDSASASTYVVAESAGTVTLKLRVAGIVPAGGVQVPFTVSGTATSGSDYTALATSNFTVPAGNYGTGTVVNASQTLTLIDDASVEDTETVVFTLGASTSTSPYVLSSTSTCGGAAVSTATVSILDNDVNVSLAKAIVGTPSDGGKFNLQISGGAPSGGTNPANDVGHGGTTGAVRVATAATVTLAETAGTGTLLTNYTPTLACTDGTGTAVTVSGSGTSRTITTPITGTTTATALTPAARTLSCTYTNTALPKLTVQKMSVGGTGVFNFVLSGVTSGTDTVTTAASGVAVASTRVHVGTGGTAATINEMANTAAGYTTTTRCVDANSAITGNTTPVTGTGTAITIPMANMKGGADYTCTFTNTAISALKLVKTSSTPSFAVGVPASYTLTLNNTGVFATQADTVITDTVPATLTLGTMPAGCGAAGQVVSCTVPTGLPATTGTASFVIPVTPLVAARPSVSNTATANGGGDPACIGTGNCTSTLVTPVLALPLVTVRKTTSNGTGSNVFGYTLGGVTNATDTITLTGATTVASAVVHTGTVGVEATLAESSVPVGWPASPAAVSCLDAAAATSGNATTNLATLSGNTATLPASVMKGGAAITCTFTNTALPIIALGKTAQATVAPGGAIAYGLSLTNTGAVATGTTVVVREQLPPGVVATSVTLGTGVTAVNCGTLPSAAGAALNCTMTITAGIPALTGVRGFTLIATAPTSQALAANGTVLTNYANTNAVGSGTAATAPGASCVSDTTVSCANASSTVVTGAGAVAQSGVRTVTDNQLADGSAQDVLEAVVRDAAQNPVAGAVVNFAATANVAFNGGAVGAAGNCTTNTAGTCQVTATSTLVGSKSSAVSIAAGALTGAFTAGSNTYQASPVTYSFVLGAPSAAMSGLRVVTDNALANGAAQDVLQVLVRDAGGNPVGTGTVVSFGATPDVAFNGGAVGADGACTTAATGLCQVTATSTVAAVYGTTPVTVGGAVLAGTFTASGNNYRPSPQPYRFGTMPTLTIRKISLNAIGTFDFTGTNGVGAQSITTLVDGSPAAGATWTLTAPNTAMTLTEAVPPAGFTLTTASCTGMGAGGTATLSGRVLSLNAAATAPGSNLVCTFTNTGSMTEPPPIPPTIMCTTNAAVFNTGYGPTGPLTSGRDTVWESGEGTPAGGPASVASWQRSYVGNQAQGAWINSPFSNANWNSNYLASTGQGPNNVDVYHRFTFNLASSVTPSSFSLKLDFYADNSVAEVFVNGVLQSVPGVPQGAANPYFYVGFQAGTAASATLASNWRAGTNTVVVHIKSGPGAEGFLAQTTTTAVCAPPTVTLSKATMGSAGGPFNFSLTNTAQASGTATTVAAGTPVQVDGSTVTAGLQAFTATAVGTAVSIAEAAVPGWNLASASCTDGGTPVGSLGTGAAARTYTIPAASVQYGKALQCLFTNAASATVTVRKVSLGGVGTFGFTGDNGLAAQSIVTATAGTAVAAGIQTLTAPGVATTVTEDPLPPNSALTSVSCTGLGAGGTATPDLPKRKVTLDAAATAAGSNIVCTFTNSFGFSVGGRVFNDNGVGAGTANDGVLGGSEAGIAGVALRLTDCAAAVLATAVTDGAGRYALAVPTATATGAPLCVEETNPATPSAWTSTGASLGSTALPSGSATTVAGIAYTYTRAGTPDRVAFVWNGTGVADLNFGDVAPNTLAADGARTGLPGSTVSYPHVFLAQTGGQVSFGILTTVNTPTLAGWSGKVFADTGCTGALQPGAALLYPPSSPVTVVAGQSLCIVMQVFIPATAMNGNRSDSTVQANFVFTSAAPGLSASYAVHDITTVSNSALDLKKEVRNVTQGGSFGINNQAKSGEVLAYRITYTNNGTTPITGMTVNDTTPSHTSFVAALADTTPVALGLCEKRTPANPLPVPAVACAASQAAGGVGALRWQFGGTLAPGASGSVSFTVKVD